MLQIVFFENEWKGVNRYRVNRWNTSESWEAFQAGPKYKEKIDNLQKIKDELNNKKKEEESEMLRSRSSLLKVSQQKWRDTLDYLSEDEMRRLTMENLVDEFVHEFDEDN